MFDHLRFARLMPLIVAAVVSNLPAPSSAQAQDHWFWTGFAGTMAENRWHEVFDPDRLKFAGSHLLGGAIGWERQIGTSRYSIGFEFQAVGHFGRQDHFEFNLPLVLRYRPRNPVPRSFRSFAFGLGPSHATKNPQVEQDRSGSSQRNFFYWMAETEFALPRSGSTVYFRLHHRSDDYGFYETNSGSTALAAGWRTEF